MAIRPTSEWGAGAWGAIPWGGNFAPFSGDQTVSPDAAVTRRNVGTPFITPPGIGPDAAPTRRNVGTVAVLGGTIALGMGFAPTRRALGVPNIAGPISMDAAPSRRFVGTPFINAFQDLAPDAAVSRRNVGNVTVNHVLSIGPAAAVTRRFVGTPTLIGGPNSIRPMPAVSRRFVGIPTLTGGNPELTVYIGGAKWQGSVLINGGSDTAAPVTYESSNPPTITSQTLGRATFNVDLFDDTGQFAPARGQTIVVMEGGLKLFAGCIQTYSYVRLMGTEETPTPWIIYHVTATDKSGICDRRVIKTITYPAGSDVAFVILDIKNNSLNGEGIIVTPQSVPTDGSLGTLDADLTFNYDTVTSGYNTIATQSGTIWYVDMNGVLTFNSFAVLPVAPFNLSLTSKNYRALMVTPTNVDYANVIYAISNLTVLPGSGAGGGGGGGTGVGSNTETYIMTPGNIGVRVLADGTTVFGVSVALPIGTLYSITVNGFTQTVVNQAQWAGQEPAFGTSDFGPWLWGSNSTDVACTVTSGALFPLSGTTLVINYTPFTSNAAGTLGEALAPIDPATGDTLGTCGSGIYELALQVKNVSDVGSLNAIAAAELVKRDGVPVTITYQTDKPGLQVGMIQTVDRPDLFLNNLDFLITSLTGIAAASPLEFGSRFQWQVTAVTNKDPGNYIQWFANLFKNASNALPVYQYEDASFVLAPGSSLAGGLVPGNPYQVKRTGQLAQIYAAVAQPPQDQDARISFRVNGIDIPGFVTVPGGSAPDTSFVFQFPDINPLFVFNTATETDIIRCFVTYVVTGPNPIPLGSGSAALRWRM